MGPGGGGGRGGRLSSNLNTNSDLKDGRKRESKTWSLQLPCVRFMAFV